MQKLIGFATKRCGYVVADQVKRATPDRVLIPLS